MNCKPGEFAIVIKGYKENIGGLVHIVDSHRCEVGEWRVKAMNNFRTQLGHVNAGELVWAWDSHLRPIRPDETTEQSAETMRLLHQLPAQLPKETA